jgi:hypothetical protein
MASLERNPARVKIVKRRRFSVLEVKAVVYEFKQRVVGKSSGPREVRKLLRHQSSFGKVSEFNARKVVDSLWVPENEQLLIRLLKSKIPARRIFIGPNIATEKPKLSELILQNTNTRVLVPSMSMRDILLARNLGYSQDNILIWFAGVDHRLWNPKADINRDLVMIYQKGPNSEARVKLVEKSLRELNLPSVTIKYGEYRQSEYFKLLNRCKFVIWVGHTETQGIAQFQAWSMDVPTLISGLPKERLEEPDGLVASPAPYLSDNTGMIARLEQPSNEEIISMNESIQHFSPRLWVIENATQELAISNLAKAFDDQLAN